MTLTVAVQMDPIQRIKITGNSTFAMLLEAQVRGHSLMHYTPDRLSMRDSAVTAVAEPIEVRDVDGDHVAMGEPRRIDLSTMDVVLLRQDPPFDLAYITTTHLLERIHPRTLVVNDPAHVRNAPEKIFGPLSMAGTISPPGIWVTATPIFWNTSVARPTVRYFMPFMSSRT